ncbi:MAG: sulfite exporter TauE/SafE family protein, partial [Acidimicrobiales bacterium]|nr:sulfite exporter TauE/SafE family protein [Acidimicrobiales bacterium]
TVVKVVAAGTVVGFMTGFFGVGGGFIIVPALVLALGFDMPTAIGTSLLVIAVNCAVALASRLATTGVDWHVALPFTVAALAGAVAGNHLASRTRASTLLRWFAVLLVAVAAYTLARSLASL